MKFHKYLNDILGSNLKIDILRFLIKLKLEFSGRKVATSIGFHKEDMVNA